MNCLRNKNYQILFCILACVFAFSCRKDIGYDNGPVHIPDFTVKVTSSVSGFITDENDDPISATVSAGGNTITADRFGYFEIKNIQVVKTAATVTVTRPGYFKSIKTFIATDQKAAFFRIKLIRKTNSGNINAASGGNITLSNGLIISLPGNAVVNAATNAAYSGIVNAAAYWIDPTSTELNKIMPGDLRGIATDGSLKGLTTYGMAAVELTGSGGELLQIATGYKATLTMPIPVSILSNAPQSIPLWYFDETKGLWKQEGQASRSGNNYTGDVSHFSFWNCDVPDSYVEFNCTLKDQNGNPLPYTLVKINEIGSSNSSSGYTDESGYVAGLVPDNAQLLLSVLPYTNCVGSIYSQNISTTNTSISLGTVTISTSSNTANISGTVTDCNNSPVLNGYIYLSAFNHLFRQPISNSGTFNFPILMCGNSADITLIAENTQTLQQNNPSNHTIHTGVNAIGNLQACGFNAEQFFHYTIDGVNGLFTVPSDNISIVVSAEVWVDANGTAGHAGLYFFGLNIGLNSSHNLMGFAAPGWNLGSQVGTDMVHITEYGLPGQFISGNFTGVLKTNDNVPHSIVCSFRVRRP